MDQHRRARAGSPPECTAVRKGRAVIAASMRLVHPVARGGSGNSRQRQMISSAETTAISASAASRAPDRQARIQQARMPGRGSCSVMRGQSQQVAHSGLIPFPPRCIMVSQSHRKATPMPADVAVRAGPGPIIPCTSPCSSKSGLTVASAQNSASRAPYQLPCPPNRPRDQPRQRRQAIPKRDRRQNRQPARQKARQGRGFFGQKRLARGGGPLPDQGDDQEHHQQGKGKRL